MFKFDYNLVDENGVIHLNKNSQSLKVFAQFKNKKCYYNI